MVIFDADSLGTGPDSVGTAITDEFGHFGPIAINNVDADEGGKLDLYTSAMLDQFCASGARFTVLN